MTRANAVVFDEFQTEDSLTLRMDVLSLKRQMTRSNTASVFESLKLRRKSHKDQLQFELKAYVATETSNNTPQMGKSTQNDVVLRQVALKKSRVPLVYTKRELVLKKDGSFSFSEKITKTRIGKLKFYCVTLTHVASVASEKNVLTLVLKDNCMPVEVRQKLGHLVFKLETSQLAKRWAEAVDNFMN